MDHQINGWTDGRMNEWTKCPLTDVKLKYSGAREDE